MDELRECPCCKSRSSYETYMGTGYCRIIHEQGCALARVDELHESQVGAWNHRPAEDRLQAENERLEREKAEWERLYEKKQNSYDALVVAYNDLKVTMEGGSRE